MTSYDNRTYIFNGFGKFILSRAVDNSFEIQAKTSLIKNVNSYNSSSQLLGTVFTGFAIQTSKSSIFEFELSRADTPNPYLSKDLVT